MPAFENYGADAAQLETEIARKGVVLGIDWNNERQVRDLARQALACRETTFKPDCDPASPEGLAKLELFGLTQLMLKLMEQGADEGVEVHGGPVWKAFARALWAEKGDSRE